LQASADADRGNLLSSRSAVKKRGMLVSRGTIHRALVALLAGAGLYAGFAYAVEPWVWRHYERQQGLADRAMVTTTKLGIPGDALNVGLEGSSDDGICAMRAAAWNPADPVTLRSSVAIAGSVLAHRAYATAPVSDLYYEGRKQDFAFQKPSGKSPSHRHHVRIWKAIDQGRDGLFVWLGAATYDRSVGVSHYTWQVTHHIAPDIDAERNLLAVDVAAAGHVARTYTISDVGPTLWARNGGGDPYFTDGEIEFLQLAPGCQSSAAAPAAAPEPPASKAKNAVFR
jgi:hypothetical protein